MCWQTLFSKNFLWSSFYVIFFIINSWAAGAHGCYWGAGSRTLQTVKKWTFHVTIFLNDQGSNFAFEEEKLTDIHLRSWQAAQLRQVHIIGSVQFDRTHIYQDYLGGPYFIGILDAIPHVHKAWRDLPRTSLKKSSAVFSSLRPQSLVSDCRGFNHQKGKYCERFFFFFHIYSHQGEEYITLYRYNGSTILDNFNDLIFPALTHHVIVHIPSYKQVEYLPQK